MPINNESIGISAEVAIAYSFKLPVNPAYEARAERDIVNLLMRDGIIIEIFKREGIPTPISHIAEGQNPVDFLLRDGKTLSVKTNQYELGKVAPQIIGQPTAETYFSYLEDFFDSFSLCEALKEEHLIDNYENRSYIFKKISMENTAAVVDMYWQNLFDCDYYLHFYNVLCHKNPLDNYVTLEKEQPPIWDNRLFTFTQSLQNWNESNTLKYRGITMGEFQVHRNRNCFKFRFNLKGILELLKQGWI